MQVVRWVRDFALDSAGRRRLARMAMIAMTTSNSINVKPRRRHGSGREELEGK